MKILFVCMGNICRSPAAENVMRDVANREGLADAFELDSAGTISYHEGNPPDPRMRKAAKNRGIEMTGRARQIRARDLEESDLVLVADRDNLADVERLAANVASPCAVRLFCEFCTESENEEVPDPYYGGDDGFETVLDILEDGCAEIARRYRSGKLG
ncbi:MAG: low molecular weight protein-tyrosine-phosphatase [Verrucomicrobiota bacterium]